MIDAETFLKFLNRYSPVNALDLDQIEECVRISPDHSEIYTLKLIELLINEMK